MGISTNFGAVAQDYATFRAGFPDSLFDRLASLGVRAEGQHVVDIGTGTGTLARGFARRGARVTAVDPDERMLEQAKQLDLLAQVTVEYKVGRAEALPLADGVADIVCAGQCWHWFDGLVAAREMARIVRPGGRVVIAHFDWLPLPGTVAHATELLVVKHNPASQHLAGGNGFHPESVPDLRAAGFSGFENFSYEVDVAYTPEAWRGRNRASVMIGASLSAPAVEAFDAELTLMLNESFPGRSLAVPHRVFAIVATLGSAR